MKNLPSPLIGLTLAIVFAGCNPQVTPYQFDVAYCSGVPAYENQKLRIQLPNTTAPASGWPAILYFPGDTTSNTTFNSAMSTAVSRGYAAVFVNYVQNNELGYTAPYVQPFQIAAQARCAVRFLRRNSRDYAVTEAASYKIDPNRIAVFGHSLGGLAASSLALASDANWEQLKTNVGDQAQNIIDNNIPNSITYLETLNDPADLQNVLDSHNNPVDSSVQAAIFASTSADFLTQMTFCRRGNPLFAQISLPTGCELYTYANNMMPTTPTRGSENTYRGSFQKGLFQVAITESNPNGTEKIYPGQVVNLLPPVVDLDIAASPIGYADDATYHPPILWIAGTTDPKVDKSNSEIGGRYLQSIGRFSKTVILQDGEHNFFYDNAAWKDASQALWFDFLDVVFDPAFDQSQRAFDTLYQNKTGNAVATHFCDNPSETLSSHCDEGT